MRAAFAALALAAAVVADPFPGAVSGSIAPTTSAPSSCVKTYPGDFSIQDTLLSSKKRSLKPRDTSLYITLTNGVLTDTDGRTGYVAANGQFQFDKPPQAGAIYTAGFSVCSNGSLTLGDDSLWYSCESGGFSNLYYSNQGSQCTEVTIQVIPSSGSATTAAPSGATTAATTAASSECTEYSDGQPQCTTVTAAPSSVCTEYSDGQPQCTAVTAAVCTEYSDGQPQCSAVTAAPVCSEYSDGQPQCSTATEAATTAAVCSEYSDGQPQCATTTAAVCSEYSDGQPQCSTATAAATTAACSEYVDGQPQCSVGTATAAVVSTSYTGAPIATGAASPIGMQKELFGLAAAGVIAVAVL